MGRQERRRRLRQTEPKIKWESIIVYAVVAFFALTALYSYLFPQINARAYASGPRVQKIIVNRGLDNVTKKGTLEFTYSYSADTEEATVQYQVKEEPSKVTLTDTEEKTSTEYPLTNLPAEYRTVAQTTADIRAALKDKSFKIRHQADNNYHYQLNVVKQISATEYEGYDLYFTAEHALDIVHYYKVPAEGKAVQRIYYGLTTGIYVAPEEDTTP